MKKGLIKVFLWDSNLSYLSGNYIRANPSKDGDAKLKSLSHICERQPVAGAGWTDGIKKKTVAVGNFYRRSIFMELQYTFVQG